jgi:hypothetical protein
VRMRVRVSVRCRHVVRCLWEIKRINIARTETQMFVVRRAGVSRFLFRLSAGDACPVLAADPERLRPGVARFSFAFMFIWMFVRSLLGSRSVVVRWMFRFCTVVIRVFLGVCSELVRGVLGVFSGSSRGRCSWGVVGVSLGCSWGVVGV